MKVENTRLKDVFIITPEIFGDDRGFFLESWNSKNFRSAGLDINFVQDNTSRSSKGILRGLHFQLNQPQGKLVKVSRGEVFDVAVDLRRSSPSFGQWFGITLNDINHKMLWIPEGFAHGFCVTSSTADFQYKCTNYYDPDSEFTLAWNDPTVGISWPLPDQKSPTLSGKDRDPLAWSEIPFFD